MQSWYKLSQQKDFDFYEDVEVIDPPIPQELINAPKTVEMLDEVIENVEGYWKLAEVLNQNGFAWNEVDLNENKIIIVQIEPKLYVIESFDFPESTEANTWIDNMYEHELYSYMPPSEDEDFWRDIPMGYTVYHATSKKNLATIMTDGLEPRNETRGISNRHTGSAVFTSENVEETDSYGDVLIEINVGQMKADNYMPNASRETPIEEIQVRNTLAYKIGLPYYEPSSDLGSDGISESTVVFYGIIPPKYLTVL